VTANKKGEKSVVLRTIGSEKSRITVMSSVSAHGEKLSPHIICLFIESVDSGLNGNAITRMGNGVFLVMAYSY